MLKRTFAAELGHGGRVRLLDKGFFPLKLLSPHNQLSSFICVLLFSEHFLQGNKKEECQVGSERKVPNMLSQTY